MKLTMGLRRRSAWLAMVLFLAMAGLSVRAADPLQHAQNRLFTSLGTRASALIKDTDGDLDIDDPEDRDFIRTLVDDRVIQFANHFASNLDVDRLKESLSRLVDPAMVAAVPSSFWDALTGLPQLPRDGTWTDEDSADLRKVRSAYMLVSLMEFGAPGKFALFDDPTLGERGGVEEFDAVKETPPGLLARLKEYEDAYQRLMIIRLLGAQTGPDPAVAGLNAARGLVAGIQNAPGEALLQQWWGTILSGPLKPAADIWRLNDQWWQLNPSSGAVQAKGDELDSADPSKPAILSGAQLLSTELSRIQASNLGADAILERLATADNWKLEAKYQSYPIGADVASGVWSVNGLTLSYAPPGGTPKSPARTSNVVCMSLRMVNKPIELLAFDHSYQVSHGESYPPMGGPMLPARSFLQFLDQLLEARVKYATDVPETLPSFGGSTSGSSSQSGAFSSSVGLGASL